MLFFIEHINRPKKHVNGLLKSTHDINMRLEIIEKIFVLLIFAPPPSHKEKLLDYDNENFFISFQFDSRSYNSELSTMQTFEKCSVKEKD